METTIRLSYVGGFIIFGALNLFVSGVAHAQSQIQDLSYDSLWKRFQRLDKQETRTLGLNASIGGTYQFLVRSDRGNEHLQYADGALGSFSLSYSPPKGSAWEIQYSVMTGNHRFDWREPNLRFDGNAPTKGQSLVAKQFFRGGEVGLRLESKALKASGHAPQLGQTFNLFGVNPEFHLEDTTHEIGFFGYASIGKRLRFSYDLTSMSVNGALGLSGGASGSSLGVRLPASGYSRQVALKYDWSARDSISLLYSDGQFSGQGSTFREGDIAIGETSLSGYSNHFGLLFAEKKHERDYWSIWTGYSEAGSHVRVHFPDATVLGIGAPIGTRALAQLDFRQSSLEIGASVTRPKGSTSSWTETLRIAKMPTIFQTSYQLAQFLNASYGTATSDLSRLIMVTPSIGYRTKFGKATFEFNLEQAIPFMTPKRHAPSKPGTGPQRITVGGTLFTATVSFHF